MTFRVCRTKRAPMFQCRSAVDVMLQFSMNLKRKTKLRINTILDSTAWKYSNFGAPWGPPGASLEPTGGLLASSSRFPGACWVPPGGLSWGSPGEVPGSRGGVLWGLLGASRSALEREGSHGCIPRPSNSLLCHALLCGATP